MKIAVIGGGSSYTPELVEGIIRRYTSFPVKELRLADIPQGEAKLTAVAGLAHRMIGKAGLREAIKVTATLQRREALAGAAFVVSQFRVGGAAARVKDEQIPLAYGIAGQETTGPGGFAQALRNIPAALELSREMKELCPGALMINFTNPSGMITEAVNTLSGGIRAVGLCNIPLAMRKTLAAVLGVEACRLELDFTGLNHLSWIIKTRLDGVDITEKLLAVPETALLFTYDLPGVEENDVRTLFAALGAVPSPYLRYYYFPEQSFRQVRDQSAAGSGTRAEQVLALEEELFRLYRDPALDHKPPQLSLRGGAWYSEAAVSLMESVYSGGASGHVLNITNGGMVPDLPESAVIETNCSVRGREISALNPGPLPAAVRGLVQQVKAYEQLAVAAAAEGDCRKAYLALLNHPLVPGASAARALLDDILRVNAAYLPRFRN